MGSTPPGVAGCAGPACVRGWRRAPRGGPGPRPKRTARPPRRPAGRKASRPAVGAATRRSEEHTSELQSRENLVCRLLLEKKKKTTLCSVHLSRDTHYSD